MGGRGPLCEINLSELTDSLRISVPAGCQIATPRIFERKPSITSCGSSEVTC